jgi:hypothetical protein
MGINAKIIDKKMNLPSSLNIALSLFIPTVALFLPLLFDDNVAKLLAVALGAFIGGIGIDYIRPEKTVWRNARKILCSSLFAIPPSFAISRYYELNYWEYSLLLGFVNGLIAIILVSVILAIAEENLKGIIAKILLNNTRIEVEKKEIEEQ